VTLSPRLLAEGMTAVAVDTLERQIDGGTVRLSGNALSVTLPAYGIASVCLKQGGG
jgi:hypothetical protein